MDIIISTQDHLGEYKIVKTLGLVQGNIVRSRNIARNIIANFRTLFGGEIKEFTQAISEAREHAIKRMLEQAKNLDADAIVGMRIVASDIDSTCSEVLVYGTAVKIIKV